MSRQIVMDKGPAPFAHPETGEALETHEDFRDALLDVETRLAPLYRVRRTLRDEMTTRYEPVLPEKRWQSMTQEKVARCPRCRTELPG
jgi:hypothetical protein